MATQAVPLKRENLNLFADAIVSTAGHYYNLVGSNKATPNELAKNLKRLKLLIALSDGEIAQLRSQK